MKSEERQRPTRFSAAPEDGGTKDKFALVESSIAQGSVILAGPKGDIALDWRKGDKDRVRGIPPGTYRVRTVRIERTKGKDQWFLSMTQPPKKPLRFSSSKRVKLDTSDTIRFAAHARPAGKKKLSLGFSIKGKAGEGLSIYRNGKRVSVTYTMFDAKGHRLGSGKMNYG